jgi:hypothetical protein
MNLPSLILNVICEKEMFYMDDEFKRAKENYLKHLKVTSKNSPQSMWEYQQIWYN